MPQDKEGRWYFEGDENADWIKLVDGGKHKEEEMRVHAILQEQYKKAREAKEAEEKPRS